MRSMAFMLAAALVGVSWQSAVGGEGCRGCSKLVDGGAWCGPACSSPPGYTLVPGCCENTHPCCNNAWAGYCEHRAKVQAFWAKVGTPRPCTGIFSPIMPCAPAHAKVVCVPSCEQPTPAVPVAVPPKVPVEKP